MATHAVANIGGMRTGWNVLITGAGPVGLLAMAVAKGLGAGKVIAVDINEQRLDFAKQYAATDTYIPVRFLCRQWKALMTVPDVVIDPAQ